MRQALRESRLWPRPVFHSLREIDPESYINFKGSLLLSCNWSFMKFSLTGVGGGIGGLTNRPNTSGNISLSRPILCALAPKPVINNEHLYLGLNRVASKSGLKDGFYPSCLALFPSLLSLSLSSLKQTSVFVSFLFIDWFAWIQICASLRHSTSPLLHPSLIFSSCPWFLTSSLFHLPPLSFILFLLLLLQQIPRFLPPLHPLLPEGF